MTTSDARHFAIHAHLFLEPVEQVLAALDGDGVQMIAVLSTLGSRDPSPWPPFRIAVVVPCPIDVELAAHRLGFAYGVDHEGNALQAHGVLDGMHVLIFSSWRPRHAQGELE